MNVGARLRACHLDSFEPYQQPRPLEQRTQTIHEAGLTTVTTVLVDPEDEPDAEPLAG